MYDKIKDEIRQTYYVQNFPNDGQRFVAWYLRNIHLRDMNETKDCITDGQDDKQIDAIVIDDDVSPQRPPTSLLRAHPDRRPPVVVLINTLRDAELLPWFEKLEAVHVLQYESVQRFNDLHVTLRKRTLSAHAMPAPAGMVATLQVYDRWHYRWKARRTVKLDGLGGAAFRVPRGARTYARVVLRRPAGPALVASRVIRTSDGRTAADPDTLTPPGSGGGGHGGH